MTAGEAKLQSRDQRCVTPQHGRLPRQEANFSCNLVLHQPTLALSTTRERSMPHVHCTRDTSHAFALHCPGDRLLVPARDIAPFQV